ICSVDFMWCVCGRISWSMSVPPSLFPLGNSSDHCCHFMVPGRGGTSTTFLLACSYRLRLHIKLITRVTTKKARKMRTKAAAKLESTTLKRPGCHIAPSLQRSVSRLYFFCKPFDPSLTAEEMNDCKRSASCMNLNMKKRLKLNVRSQT